MLRLSWRYPLLELGLEAGRDASRKLSEQAALRRRAAMVVSRYTRRRQYRRPEKVRPPPPPRSERALASVTVRFRPWTARPFRPAIAFWASAFDAISTKPKPRERPLSRSVTTEADSQVPTSVKSASRSALVV